MNEMNEDKRALNRLLLARDRLMQRYPLHAAILGRMDLRKDTSIKTMAVSVYKRDDGDCKVLYHYNPDFTLLLTLDQIVAVLLHEVHHVLFGHLTMRKKDFENQAALIIAQEVTVNEFIKEPLPKDIKDAEGNVVFDKAVLLEDYPDLPPMESTIERYNRLKDVIPQITIVITLDDHGKWGVKVEGKGKCSGVSEEEIEEAVGKIIEEAMEDVFAEDLPEDLKDALSKYGQGPAAGTYLLKHRASSGINWTSKLSRYIGRAVDVRPLYHRPNRRFPDLVGNIPGKARISGKPKIMFQIDTSGSITEEMLEQAEGEIKKIAKNFDVTIVEFGDSVYKTYQYKGVIEEVYGRGGNKGAPGLDLKYLAKWKPDLVILMTDGHLCVPITHPTLAKHPTIDGQKVPVLWLIQPRGMKPTEWGHVIYM